MSNFICDIFKGYKKLLNHLLARGTSVRRMVFNISIYYNVTNSAIITDYALGVLSCSSKKYII